MKISQQNTVILFIVILVLRVTNLNLSLTKVQTFFSQLNSELKGTFNSILIY
jgi:hypothetical protein